MALSDFRSRVVRDQNRDSKCRSVWTELRIALKPEGRHTKRKHSPDTDPAIERLPYITDQRTIKPLYELLNDLSKELTKDYVKQARLLCSGQGIPAHELDTRDPIELLRILDKHGKIGEDNTDFLKELLEKLGLRVGRDRVEEYETERRKYLQNVEILLGRSDPLFVGRVNFVSRILQVFCDKGHAQCRSVLVYGLAGTGKTKLAFESCAVYKEQTLSGTRLFRVNLRKATKMEEVGLWILNAVSGKQIIQKQFEMTLVRSWVKNCSQDTVLLLDNADDILNPSSCSRDHFIDTVTDLLSIPNHLVKLIVTSRHPIDFVGLRDLPNFTEIKLEPLQVYESLQLLTKMINQARGLSGTLSASGEALQDEESLIEIAKLCGNNPQALRAVARRLSSGFSPKSLVKLLERPTDAQRVLDPGSLGESTAVQDGRKDFEDQPMVFNSLSVMYEQLPQPLRKALLKLSIFPGSFSLSQAAKILGKEQEDCAMLDVEDLKKWSLLEQEIFDVLDTGLRENEHHYYIHPLVRSVAVGKMGSSAVYKTSYNDALRRFSAYIGGFLNKVTQLGHKDFARALARFELEKTNVLHYLELCMGHKFGSQGIADQKNGASSIPLPDTREGIFSIFEAFLDPAKRLEFYENISIMKLLSGETEAWAFLRGWMGNELYMKAKYDEAWKTVEEALNELKTRASDPNIGRTKDLERAEAQLLYVKGRILVEWRNYKDSIANLEKALSMQRHLLGKHTITARCLDALGEAYFAKADENRRSSGVQEAHEYHRQAWEMLVKITGNKPHKHFDAPMCLLNIGATFHQMGKKLMHSHKKKAREYFELAIKNYGETLDLERALKLSNTSNTALVLKNMAMSHCEMKEYEKAVPLAIDAFIIRKDVLGMHPKTARSLFFIGSLYDSLGDKYKKSKKAGEKRLSMENYDKALEYYKRAFRMEVMLKHRSIEYDDLKEDMKKLLQKFPMDTTLDSYLRVFKEADKGIPNLEDMWPVFTSESAQECPSRKRTRDDMDAEDESVTEGDSHRDETAAPSRQRAPGSMPSDERPMKRCNCRVS